MGLLLIRWWNIRKAKGKVLELGCGTGRNLKYYNFSNITSLTLIDSVREMLEVAKTKLPTASEDKSKCELQVMNAHEISSHFAKGSYDTIIDSFGLCSYEDPIFVLQEAALLLKRNDPDAKIILIEHGQSHYQWLNNQLNNGAEHHAKNWGCIWNLDIEQLVKDSEMLEITSCTRYHFGTTYIIEAKVKTDIDSVKRKKKGENCLSCSKSGDNHEHQHQHHHHPGPQYHPPGVHEYHPSSRLHTQEEVDKTIELSKQHHLPPMVPEPTLDPYFTSSSSANKKSNDKK
jgi:methyltransferase OMS1